MHPGVLLATEELLTLKKYRLQDARIESALVWEIPWRDVRRIRAYKRDLFSVDQICIAFELHDKTIQIDEGMEGYNSVVEAIAVYFPEMKADWLQTVAFPAFETNLTTIWEKSSATLVSTTPEQNPA